MNPAMMTAIDDLAKNIVEGLAKHHRKVLSQIVRENMEYGNIPPPRIRGFRYLGTLYLSEDSESRPGKGTPMPDLDGRLVDRFHQFLSDKDRINADYEYIKQCLLCVIKNTSCSTLPDLRNVLPDALADRVPDLAGIGRTMESNERVAVSPMAQRYLVKVEDQLNFYLGMSMLLS